MTGLPTPRLTATIAQPVAKGALGEVTIEGVPRPVRPRGGGDQTYRKIKCSRCGRPGHNARRRTCPPESP